ncbi:MAG: RNase A-like domain-containing protein, partial [Methyloversatilis sp.]|nr:RNase A-like domain-containing protein [Methyloversatilis sp.]
AARGGDPYSGALGAITATLVEAPLDDALDLSGPDREIALTAFSMLVGGTASGLAGGDPVTAAWTAQNVTLFNYLKHQEQDRYADAKNACGGDAACLKAVDADFSQKSQANKRALADAREACESTGFCTDYYRLMTEAMPLGKGAHLPGDMDPENPWLGAQQNADAIAHNLSLFDRLMARPLSDEIVRHDFAPDPEAYAFTPQGSSQYVGAITAQNIDKVIVLSAAGASLLLPGPEDLVVGAVLMTKAGQYVARVIEVGGQKLLRWADGSVDNAIDAATGEGAFSRIVPGGGLQAHESAGGHLLLKHVGQSEEALMKRLAKEPNITGSSSFFDRAAAEWGVSGALDARQTEIQTWLASKKPDLKIEFSMPKPVGITISRTRMQATETTRLRLILRRNSSAPDGYSILTGFPINE